MFYFILKALLLLNISILSYFDKKVSIFFSYLILKTLQSFTAKSKIVLMSSLDIIFFNPLGN